MCALGVRSFRVLAGAWVKNIGHPTSGMFSGTIRLLEHPTRFIRQSLMHLADICSKCLRTSRHARQRMNCTGRLHEATLIGRVSGTLRSNSTAKAPVFLSPFGRAAGRKIFAWAPERPTPSHRHPKHEQRFQTPKAPCPTSGPRTSPGGLLEGILYGGYHALKGYTLKPDTLYSKP